MVAVALSEQDTGKGQGDGCGDPSGWQQEGPQGRSVRNEAGDQKEAGLQQLAEGPQEGTSGDHQAGPWARAPRNQERGADA